MSGLRTVQTPSSSFQCPVGFLASQRPYHPRLTYHVLHSRAHFACFSLRKSITSGKTSTLTLLNQQHSLPIMIPNSVFFSLSQKRRFVNSLLNRLPKPACWIPSQLLSLKNAFPLNCLYETTPPQFKQAVVTPLLKKPGLDPNDFKHFRPVSNQAFISKRNISQKTDWSQCWLS